MGAVVNFMGYVGDSLTNLVSRMGTGRDKLSGNVYTASVLTDQEILDAYRGAWLPRKIVDIPAFDSVRAWRDWQAERDQIEAIEAEEKRLNVRGKVLEARIKARLWGGAAIHIGTGEANLAEPLDVERVGTGGIKHLTVLTRRHLKAGELDRVPASEWFGKPKVYTLNAGDQVQVEIHPSRLVIFAGNPQPDVELTGGGDMAWGDSVLLAVMEAIKQADGTATNVASLVFEAKIDVVRVPNFMASLKDEGYKARLLERFTLAATAKGINGTLILDKEEEYETKSASFATLPDVMDRFLQIVSGAADIPATRLLGQAPAGMNATGESDLRNYYDRLSAMQEVEMTPAMHRMDECIIRSALGSRPPVVYYEWAPLWGMSEKEKAEVFKMKADAGRALAGASGGQLLPVEALSDALVNVFTEDGSLPGLEAAIEEYGTLAEQEPSLEEQSAALALEQAANGNMPRRQAANDAAPRVEDAKRGRKKEGASVDGAKNGFDPNQPRGGNGRWIETGAESRKAPVKMTQDEIADDMLVKAKDAYAKGTKVIGIRTDDLDEADVLAPGSMLPKSRVWKNGDPTDKTLDGTSVVLVSNKAEPTLADIKDALKIMKPKYGGYFGKTVYLVGGTSARKGKDVGEGVMKGAEVLAIYGKEANVAEVTLKVS